MSRKDYEALARALNLSLRTIGPHDTATEVWSTTVVAIADALAADNPRFDRAKFIAACNV